MIHEVKDNKLSITNTSNKKGGSKIWFWNKSANKSDLNTEKDGNSKKDKNEEERNQEEKKSKI